MSDCFEKVLRRPYCVRWGGRLWPPVVLAGTEARRTEFFLDLREP
jgi:hypothetical protein